MPTAFEFLLARLEVVEAKLRTLEESVEVIEYNSISYENRLQDLEEQDEDA